MSCVKPHVVTKWQVLVMWVSIARQVEKCWSKELNWDLYPLGLKKASVFMLKVKINRFGCVADIANM